MRSHLPTGTQSRPNIWLPEDTSSAPPMQAENASQIVGYQASTQENLRAAMHFIVRDLTQAGEGIPQGGLTVPNTGTTSVIELARRFGAIKDREGRRMVFMTFSAAAGSRASAEKEFHPTLA